MFFFYFNMFAYYSQACCIFYSVARKFFAFLYNYYLHAFLLFLAQQLL